MKLAIFFALLMVSMLLFGCYKPYSSGVEKTPPPPTEIKEPQEKGCMCITLHKPVCGTDGNTYTNSCAAGCAKIKIDYEGECKKCEDSDFGKDIYKKGTTTWGSEKFDDTCMNLQKGVLEYSCGDKGVENKTYDCAQGYYCTDGACYREAKPLPLPAGCTDSDGGRDFYTSGNVTDQYGEAFNDSCTTRDNIREFYCDKGQVKSAIKTCMIDERCDNGACTKNQPSCNDIDGSDEEVYGRVDTTDQIMAKTSYYDLCNDYRSVREFICTGNYVNVTIINCRVGKECFEGKCIAIK